MKVPSGQVLNVTLALCAVAAAALGYGWGQRSVPRHPPEGWYLVAGSSMEPTIQAGARCRCLPLAEVVVGQVVAIRWGGRDRIKRVAAVGGDTVDRIEGRLFINGQRLEDRIAQQAVPILQAGKEPSQSGRANPFDILMPALVRVRSERSHWERPDSSSNWWIFRYRNPYQADRITEVFDDYPGNEAVRRQLHPVDRLVVKIPAERPGQTQRPKDKDMATQSIVAFYDMQAHATVGIRIRKGVARTRDAIRRQDAEGAVEAESDSWRAPVLDATRPIAVRLEHPVADSVDLEVWREIEFRDDRPSGKVSYPLQLLQGQIFVVGDNVPISVDSRQVGPLSTDAIVGRVDYVDQPIESTTASK